ncbi:Chaperone protein DnaJ [Paramyrothecium foliicola]|nr:Chaperone protein DnaJ [Paramyrothecium foliicola]
MYPGKIQEMDGIRLPSRRDRLAFMILILSPLLPHRLISANMAFFAPDDLLEVVTQLKKFQLQLKTFWSHLGQEFNLDSGFTMTQFLSLIGWWVLPNLVTSWVQTIYYGITIRAGDPKPTPGSARFNADRRITHILVVSLYLLYTVYEADHEIRRQSSFFADLGVPFDASPRDIKSRFRRVAAVHHPDKAGAGYEDVGTYFMHLKVASETLQDAAKKFAYERFGPDVLQWQKCTTIKDYVTRGIFSGVIPNYAVAAISFAGLGFFGYMDFAKYYRWLILLTLCVFELYTVTRPTFPAYLSFINTVLTHILRREPYVPFQVIAMARKLSMTVYIALSQIGPLLLRPSPDSQRPTPDDEKALKQGLERLEGMARMLDADTGRLMDMELAPFKGDAEATANLQGKMGEWLVQNTVRADPMVRDALGQSFRRRRIDAPAGARGNRTS